MTAVSTAVRGVGSTTPCFHLHSRRLLSPAPTLIPSVETRLSDVQLQGLSGKTNITAKKKPAGEESVLNLLEAIALSPILPILLYPLVYVFHFLQATPSAV